MSELNQYQQMDAISNGVSDFLKEKGEDFFSKAISNGVKEWLNDNHCEFTDTVLFDFDEKITRIIQAEIYRNKLYKEDRK